MRLIFLTNFYPPASRGGYEEWCLEVAEQLRGHGHQVIILTSQHRRNELTNAEPNWIRRDLYLEMDLGVSLRNSLNFFTDRKKREAKNITCLKHIVHNEKPDAILVWGMWNLPRSLAALAETLLPGRVVYYMGDYWPTLPSQYELYWQAPAKNWLTALPKKMLGLAAYRILTRETRPALKFEHILYPTAFMRDELSRKNVVPKNSSVIYGAIDSSLYKMRNGVNKNQNNLRLLYIGRLVEDKGVHTAIESVALLVHQHNLKNVTLTIVGAGNANYETYLKTLAQQKKVDSLVSFLGPKTKEEIPSLYQQADILLFTSIWQEPFGRVIIEAMASGVVVVGSATGGAVEIIRHEANGLAFSPGDSQDLSNQILKLVESPHLKNTLAHAGRKTATEKFDIARMASGIEAYLQKIKDKVTT